MALEQHAIPTQVTSYEFRLVGDMTLKQFGWLASGIILAILLYSAPLPSYIKWPLILIFAPSGAIIAFVPIEGRGIDRWIIAFVKAIYSPSEFIWRQEKPLPEFFKKGAGHPTVTSPAKVTVQDQAKLEEYIHTLPAAYETSALDRQEGQQINYIDQLLSSDSPPPPPPSISPGMPTSPSSSSLPPAAPDEELSRPAVEGSPHIVSMAGQEPTPPPSILASPGLDLEQLEQQVAATLQPAAPPVEPPGPPPPTPVPPQPVNQASETDSQLQQTMAQPTADRGLTPPSLAAIPVTFSDQMPISAPQQANLIVGMITDSQGKIVDNAIIEIKDQAQKPVRALKTNKLGQFSIATPLKDGTYYLQIEKEGLRFDNFQLQVEGKIIPPIEIKAKLG